MKLSGIIKLGTVITLASLCLLAIQMRVTKDPNNNFCTFTSGQTDSHDRPMVVVAADAVTQGACVTLASALSNGWDVSFYDPRNTFLRDVKLDAKSVKRKIQTMFLNMHRHDSPIIFVDAYDVVFVRSPKAFMQNFADIVGESRRGGDIIFSSETNCWPFNHPHWQDCPELGMGFENTTSGRRRVKANTICAAYPKARSAYRFLNSGAFVGRRRSLIKFFENIEPLKDVIPQRCILTEQGLVQHAFLSSLDDSELSSYPWRSKVQALSRGAARTKILLDTRTQLFHNLGEGALSDLVISPWKDLRIQNNGTGSEPFLLHFNGDKRPYFDIGIPLAKAFSDVSSLMKVQFRCGSNELSFSSICGKHLEEAFRDHPPVAQESWNQARSATQRSTKRP